MMSPETTNNSLDALVVGAGYVVSSRTYEGVNMLNISEPDLAGPIN